MSVSETTLAAPGGSKPLRAAALFALLAGALMLIPLATHVALYVTVMAMAVCLVGPAWYRWQTGRFDPFETINLIGLIYFIFFGWGAIWLIQDPTEVAYDKYLIPYLPRAVFYCLLGFITMLCGYFGPWFRPRRPHADSHRVVGITFILVIGALGFAGSLFESVWHQARWLNVSMPAAFSSLAQLSPLFLFIWALCWILLLSGKATALQRRMVYWVFVPATLLIGLTTLTDKSRAMTLVGVPVICLWYGRKRVPWKTLLIMGLLLIFLVFPFFNTYRVLDPRLDQTTRFAMTADIASNWSLDDYMDESIGTVKRRLAMINSVAVVVRDCGRWVPFANGETLFAPTLAFFIPRFIWPDKPALTMGRDFGETFRVVHILDQTTRIAVTVPGELYWNFDLPGILLGMALWGAMLRFLYRRYVVLRPGDPVMQAIHIVLLIQFAHFGGGLAAQVASMVRTLLVLEIFCWLGRQAGWLALRER